MSETQIEISNAEDVRLKVMVEMRIGEWKHILALTDQQGIGGTGAYYAPLDNLLRSIRSAITAIKERQSVKWPEDEK